MKKYNALFLMTMMLLPTFAQADNALKTKLLIQQDVKKLETQDNRNKVDFFELAKKNQAPVSTPNWDASATVNMSQHERSQYLLNQRDFSGLNNEVNSQRMDALKKARDNGNISNKKYQQEMRSINMYEPRPNTKQGSVGFSIPLE